MGRVQNGVFWRVMYQLPCGGPNEHGAGKGRVPGGLCYHAQRHAMGGIRAAEQILHIQFIAMGEKPLNVAPHALKQFWGARLVDVAPPHGVFTDLVPDNEFIFWRSSCSRAGVAGEYAVFGKGTVAAAQGVLLQLGGFVIPTHYATRIQSVCLQADGAMQICGAEFG